MRETLSLGIRLIGNLSFVLHSQTFGFVDTATVYRNEEYIGDVLADKKFLDSIGVTRQDLFVTTKVAPGDQGSLKCREAVLLSLSKLRLDYIDLVLIHWPGASGLDPADEQHKKLRWESWLDLEQLVREGKIKCIGVSNYTVKHLDELLSACTIRPTVNQVEFHPLLYQEKLLVYCKSKDIVLQGYSSLGSGKGVQEVLSHPVLKEIAETKDPYDIKQVTSAQVALKWSLQLGIPIIPKTSNVARLKENFDLNSFKLSEEEMEKMKSMNQNKRFCWDPETIS